MTDADTPPVLPVQDAPPAPEASSPVAAEVVATPSEPTIETAAPEPTQSEPVLEPPTPDSTGSPQAEPAPEIILEKPTPISEVSVAMPPRSIKEFFNRAMEAMKSKKQKQLEKIIAYAKQRGSITNDDVEKLLHVSDATASRYLAQLVREGRLQRSGSTSQIRYTMVGS